jgi:competence protein ComFC
MEIFYNQAVNKKGFTDLLKKKSADVLFPDSIYCISCGNVIDKSRVYSLCDICMEKTGWNTEDVCLRCGRPLEKTLLPRKGDMTCSECRNRVNYFEKGFACVSYGLYERILVSDMKERGRTFIARHMAEMMADMIISLTDHGKRTSAAYHFDYVIPVPASRHNLKRRGYNQTEILAAYLGEITGIAVLPHAIRRNRETVSMKHLSAVERAANVRGAFSLTGGAKDIAGRNVLLLDDVMTTGSTLNSCAETLKEAGAARVYLIVFAAGQARKRTE